MKDQGHQGPLVFWNRQRLAGDLPFLLKFALKVTPFKKRRLRQIFSYSVLTVAIVKKVQLSRIGSRPQAYQRAIDEVHDTLRISPLKGGSKSEFVVFMSKIQFLLNKDCYIDVGGTHTVQPFSLTFILKSYCLPALLYGCEVWHLNDSNMQKISVARKNCFRRVFSCCWRESVKPPQYFATHCQYHTCYTSVNCCFEKSCIALILLFYRNYLIACVRLLSLWVVCIFCTMCYRRICQTTRSENWFGTHLSCLCTCDLRHIISVFLMLFLIFV